MITIDELRKIAKLANLTLTPEEEVKFADQLSSIISYVEKLNEVDTSAIDEKNLTENKFEQNRFQDKESGDHLTRENALKNAKNKTDKYFVTYKKEEIEL